MSNLHPTSKPENENDSEEDDDDDEDEEEDEENKPQMTFSFIKHQGCVNRIRVYIFLLNFFINLFKLYCKTVYRTKDKIMRKFINELPININMYVFR